MGNNLPLFELIRVATPARVREAIAWWLRGDRRLRRQARQPRRRRAVEAQQRQRRPRSTTTCRPGSRRARSSRRSPTAVDDLGLPHPVHVHCNNLGVAGNAAPRSTRCARSTGRRAHLAHLQFHAYGGEPGGRPRSRAPELAEYLNAHPELSADVGQVMFGPATTMTADAPVSAVLRDLTARQVGQRRHRGRDRLRDRAVRLPREATTSTRCSGASAWSCSCSAATRGGSCSPPTTPTAARSSATRA